MYLFLHSHLRQRGALSLLCENAGRIGKRREKINESREIRVASEVLWSARRGGVGGGQKHQGWIWIRDA